MNMLMNLASLALRCTTGLSDTTVSALADRFSDASQRMSAALQSATDRAWRTLEISLAGSSWLDRAKGVLASREEQVLRGQVQAFLQSHALAELDKQGASFRQACLKELQRARKAKLIPGADLHVDEAASEAQTFARYTDPKQLVAAELQAVTVVADDLKRAGYAELARFISLCPAPGPYPLLVIAVRYFFRREVESDPRLSATWQFQQLEGLTQAQQAGFEQLHDAIAQHGAKMESLLEDVLEVVTETRDDVRAIREELQQLRELLAAQRAAPAAPAGPTPQQILELYQAVLQTVQPAAAPAVAAPAVQPAAAAIAPAAAAPPPAKESDWSQVETLVTRCQSLPKEQQRQLPALFRMVGKLKAAAGNEQARGRLFPHIASPAPKREAELVLTPESDDVPPLPDTPQERSAAPSAQPSRLRRIQGKPISPIFQAAQDKQTPPEPAASPPPSTKPVKRPISKLFDDSGRS
jgi:hypothetical protein